MNVQPTLILETNIAGIPLFVLLLAGVVLLIVGLRRRRRGRTPYCRTCGYNLTALTSDQCPECGSALMPDNRVYGESRRRKGLVITGIVLIALALLPAATVLTRVNRYRLKPDILVAGDLSSGSVLLERKAWRELMRRYDADALSGSALDRTVRICLAEQAKPAGQHLISDRVNFLGKCYTNGRLTEKQQQAFFENAALFALEVRPVVIAGDPVPYRLVKTLRCPSAPWWIDASGERVWVDDHDAPQQASGGTRLSGIGAAGYSDGIVHFDEPGSHNLHARAKFAVYRGEFANPEKSKLLYEGSLLLKTEFEIVPEERPGLVEIVDDPSLAQSVRDAIRPADFDYDPDRAYTLQGQMRIRKPPVGIAFDLLAIVEGKEYRLGTIYKKAGEQTDWTVGCKLPVDSLDAFNLLLRSNPDLLRRSVDMHRVWRGDLLYEAVPVTPAD